MRHIFRLLWVVGVCAGVALAQSKATGRLEPVDLVHPVVGTAHEGQTFPAVGTPFAMTQWTPQTRAGEAKCVAPYYVADTKIQGFRGSHWMSGSCTQDYGSVTLMPLPDSSRLQADERASGFDRGEVMHPYEYR
jgi:putative alpha-1,2-mannosidase